jgi:hypothetical protein
MVAPDSSFVSSPIAINWSENRGFSGAFRSRGPGVRARGEATAAPMLEQNRSTVWMKSSKAFLPAVGGDAWSFRTDGSMCLRGEPSGMRQLQGSCEHVRVVRH